VPRFVAGKPPLGRLQDPTRCRKVESISQVRANYAATLTREVVMRNHPIVSQEAWLGMVLAMVVTILAITTGAPRRIVRTIRLCRSPRGKRSTGLNTGMRTKGRQLRRNADA
jgi:hypothetical protein